MPSRGAAAFDPDPELLRLLMETGYLATGGGMHAEAEIIFDGVRAVRPGSELPLIGMALVQMNRGEPLQAGKLLREEALVLNPESELARGFLGFALRLAGSNRDAEAILEEVVHANRDKVAVQMAQSLLQERI